MYFSVHLLLFRDQIISVASWYMLEVTCSFCKCGQLWFTGSLYCLLSWDIVVKPPNQQKPETGFESLTYSILSFTWYIFQETYLLEPMQKNFKKINSSKLELTFPSGCGTLGRYTTTESSFCPGLNWITSGYEDREVEWGCKLKPEKILQTWGITRKKTLTKS